MRIAVVDPSRTVLKIVAQLLEARNHEVRSFTDGRVALEHLQSNPDVDALITSMELASMSGVELCRQVRALAPGGRPIYVVLMSSNYDRSKLIEALDSGADDFISKPPAIEELYARLRSAERLGDMQRKLYKLATTDPLTGALYQAKQNGRNRVVVFGAEVLKLAHGMPEGPVRARARAS